MCNDDLSCHLSGAESQVQRWIRTQEQAPENIARELKDTSVVMTRFDIGDNMQGMIGVVGPTRMDYAQVTARLSYFTEALSRMFGKPGNPTLPQPKNNSEE